MGDVGPRHDLGNGMEVARLDDSPDGQRNWMLFMDGHAIGGFNDRIWTVTGPDDKLTVRASLHASPPKGPHGWITDGVWRDA